MRVTEPIEGGVPMTPVTPTELGGTRHSLAVQFVHDQRDAVALVASQDRRFTVFAWSVRRGARSRPSRGSVAALGRSTVDRRQSTVGALIPDTWFTG